MSLPTITGPWPILTGLAVAMVAVGLYVFIKWRAERIRQGKLWLEARDSPPEWHADVNDLKWFSVAGSSGKKMFYEIVGLSRIGIICKFQGYKGNTKSSPKQKRKGVTHG